jgi:hypothetical protein
MFYFLEEKIKHSPSSNKINEKTKRKFGFFRRISGARNGRRSGDR